MTDLTFTRSIIFTIPGQKTSPGVKITAVENSFGGIDFTAEVLGTSSMTADLRGLFFNVNDISKLTGVRYVGNSVTDFRSGSVIDLGQGANMHGAANPFDVGLEFGHAGIGRGDDIALARFSLLPASGSTLTLDDIANVQFGARLTSIGAHDGARGGSSKLVAEAPAAPDARDDSYNIFEDGQGGLDDAADKSVGVKFQVLSNDTDADGDVLSVVALKGGLHGKIEIVDGDDADTLVGDAILYTADTDYAGTDSFLYAISDGAGGTDFATVNINVTAVADVPDLSYRIERGSTVNEVKLVVNTAQTDDDGSEYIDRIELSGLPQGVTVTESVFRTSDKPSSVQEKVFVLTLDKERDFDFDLTLTSVSKEKSNGDEQTKAETVAIEYNQEDFDFDYSFLANDQSMWNTGDAFQANYERFFGVQGTVDEDASVSIAGGSAYVDLYGNYRFGLESSLSVDGGLVDAQTRYSGNVDSYYNQATDWLHIETIAFHDLLSSWFATSSPDLNYSLDLVGSADVDMTIGAGVDLSKSIETGFDPLDSVVKTVTKYFSFYESTTLSPNFNFDLDLVTFDGQNFSFGPNSFEPAFENEYSWELGDFLELKVEVPHIDSQSTVNIPGNYLTSRGTTGDGDGNFLQLSFDVDKALSILAGLPFNPLGDSVTIASIFEVGYDILNYELQGNIDLGQNYFMDFPALKGEIFFEDNTSQLFTFGNSLDFFNASSKDVDKDGYVEYSILLSPEARFFSDFFLNPSLSHELEAGKLSGTISTPWPFSNIGVELGPAETLVDGTLWETDIKIIGMDPFKFNFESKGLTNLFT